MLHTLRFSLQSAVYFLMLPILVPVLFTFYIQAVQKFKCKIPVPKGQQDNYRRRYETFGSAGSNGCQKLVDPRIGVGLITLLLNHLVYNKPYRNLIVFKHSRVCIIRMTFRRPGVSAELVQVGRLAVQVVFVASCLANPALTVVQNLPSRAYVCT